MFETLQRMLSDTNLRLVESINVQARTEIRKGIPKELAKGPVSSVLKKGLPDGLVWKHQADALEYLHKGHNVAISTGTASGKSLIFQLYALHRLLTDPDSKILAFYPLIALTNDQMESWKEISQLGGFQPDVVGQIYGGISMSERENVLESGRIVLMTPDVCQAWMMRNLGSPSINRFIDSLSLIILDEAHVYESVFGSNAAFLFRRLLTAKRQVSGRGRDSRQAQLIAASATIDNPEEHLRHLTGDRFQVVGESENGAPRSPRQIMHIEGPEQGIEGEDVIAQIINNICNMPERHRFIAFVDSRQGVERIVKSVGNRNVKPYRSGYASEDRGAIERALRNGTLQGVVSTSALELGIDISDIDIGINIGVPQSRKSLRQRLGRVGRVSPGVFLIVAPANAFTRFGENLEKYFASSVEPSYLYLDNRFVQFAHAKCLREESEALGRNPNEVPGGIDWPTDFSDIVKMCGVSYPHEFDALAQIGADSPHFNYPLRQLGETKVKILQGSGSYATNIGDITYQQAIREAYPGATYLHLGTAYKVNQWRQGFNELEIRVRLTPNAAPTRPILRKSVTIDLSEQGIISKRLKRSATGILAEANVQVNESVEGFSVGSNRFMYRDERAKNSNMRRKQRNFRTTGVVLQIEEEWFSSPYIKREVANGFKELLARDQSIAPQDIDSANTNIALIGAGSRHMVTDIIVVYDSVYGGLRLTEKLFDEFGRYIERLSLGATLSNGNGIVRAETAERLAKWAHGLSDSDTFHRSHSTTIEPPPDGHWLQVFKPGSLVNIFIHGNPVERTIIEPVYRDFFNTGSSVLYYKYLDEHTDNSYTPAESVQELGHEWEWTWWNPETNEFREMEPPED